MQISDLAAWVRWARRAVGGAAAGHAGRTRSTRSWRSGSATCPRPAVGHAVGRRGAAHQDDPPPGLVAHRRHLRVRRADHRPAPARHRAHEPPAAASCATRATPCWWWSTSPRTIAIADHVVDLGPGAGSAGGRWCFEGDRGRAAAATRSPAATSTTGPRLKAEVRTPTGALEMRGASAAQPAGRGRGHPARGAGRGHRRGRLGQELADPRLGAGRDGVVTVDQSADPRLAAQQPGHLHRLLEPIRKAFAKANGVKPALFSANSEGACPACNGAGVIYTDLGMMAGGRHGLRGVRGQALPGGGARVPPRRARHRRGAGPAGRRGRVGLLRRGRGAHPGRARHPRRGWPTSGSATCASASRSPRCRAASASG
jgi:hypothetical protein